MVVDYIITSNVDKAIEHYLNTVFNSESDKTYQETFRALPKETKRMLVYNILKTQAETLRESIKACESTTLPGFGTFKYREGKKRVQVVKDKLAQQYGYLTYADIEDDVIKDKIKDKVNVMKHDVLKAEHIERIKLGRSYANAKVYTQLRKN